MKQTVGRQQQGLIFGGMIAEGWITEKKQTEGNRAVTEIG